MTNIKSLICVGAIVALLVGCRDTAAEYDKTQSYASDTLTGCRVARVESPRFGEPDLYVVRCPLSVTTTSFKSGKQTRHTVVIDGQEYMSAAVPAPTN